MLPLQRVFLAFLLLLGVGASAFAEEFEDLRAITPPRLSYVDGEISFWRPGAEDWLSARLNTPIAVGDELYAAEGANFELQIGSRNFVRGDALTQLALVNQEPDYLQFKVTMGRVSLDLRQLDPGMTVEVATPNAVFTIAQAGYYRLDVNYDTHFITRRGGRATVIPAGGRALSILPSEEIVVRGGTVRVETYVAPDPDRWDRWNFARTDDLLEATSVRYLPPGVYGAHELDRYGSWRVVADFGPVWIPDGLPHGWAPYSTGSWVWDPYYEWTWVDDAPWGWAPFHYGRWVFIDGFWAWAPGPVAVRRPVYSPALVSFFWAGDDISVRIGIGTPGLFWVALSWGEPCVPWWGRPGFRGKPWWGGWHGPRVVNNVVIKNTTVVNVTNIVYRNTKVDKAVVYLPREHFGRAHERARHVERVNVREMSHVHGALPVKPGPESLAVGTRKGIQPPKEVAARPVVVTRPPRETKLPWRNDRPVVRDLPPAPPKVVAPPPRQDDSRLRRPEYGTQGMEERPRPPQPTRFREMPMPASSPAPVPQNRERDAQSSREAAPPPSRMEREVPAERQRPAVQAGPQSREMTQSREAREIRQERPETGAPRQEVRTHERVQEQERPLPGKPANRVYRKGGQDEPDKDRGRGQR
jgi:hypothetical protein